MFSRSPSRPARLLAPALVLALSVLLAACGGDAGSSDRLSGTPTDSAAESAGFPVTIEHALGSTTIEERPERVVVVGYTDVQPVLALGVKPVGVMPWFGEDTDMTWPWIQDAWGGDTATYVATSGGQVNFEKVASLRPDVILGLYADLDKATYKTLSAIAPTIAQDGDYPAYSTPWDAMTRTAGLALGRSAEAETMVADIEQRFADVRAEHPEFADLTGLVVDANGESYFPFGPQDPRGVFMGSLGFQVPAATKQYLGDTFGKELSQERLDLIEADRLIMLNDGETEQQLADNTLFTSLDVVKDGGMISLPYSDAPAYGAAIAYNNVLSIPYALDNIVPLLAAAGEKG